MSTYKEYRVNGSHRQPEDHSEKPDVTCLNCGTIYKGNFCPTCGQKATTKRMTIALAIENLFGVMASFDRGLIHTMRELVTRPGYMIRDYLEGRRAEYIRPIQLLFLIATVYVVTGFLLGHQLMGLDNIQIELKDLNNERIKNFLEAFNGLMSNISIITILSALWMSVPNWLTFKMTKYGKTVSITEHFYIMVFASCSQLIFDYPLLLFSKFVDELTTWATILNFFIMWWILKELFATTRTRSFFLYVLSYAILIIIAFIVMIIIIAILVSLPEDSLAETVKTINVQ